MTEQELKDAVVEANEALALAIAAARDAGIIVNLWVAGTGPTSTGPSEVGLDFSD